MKWTAAVLGLVVLLISGCTIPGIMFSEFPGYTFEEVYSSSPNCIYASICCPSTGNEFCYATISYPMGSRDKVLNPGECWSRTGGVYGGCTAKVYAANPIIEPEPVIEPEPPAEEPPAEEYCGDGICQPPETSADCPEDCPAEELPTETLIGEGDCMTTHTMMCWIYGKEDVTSYPSGCHFIEYGPYGQVGRDIIISAGQETYCSDYKTSGTWRMYALDYDGSYGYCGDGFCNDYEKIQGGRCARDCFIFEPPAPEFDIGQWLVGLFAGIQDWLCTNLNIC